MDTQHIQSQTPANARLPHLQGLRAVAAMLVVAAHALEYPVRRQILGEDVYIWAWLLGWSGVATFFVISGFIMVHSSYDAFGSAAAARRFALHRIIKVVPIYWLATLPFAIAAMARGDAISIEQVARSLLFIPYLTPGQDVMRPIVGQGWTLNYEMFFYALFAAALLLKRRAGLMAIIGILTVLVVSRWAAWPPPIYADPVTPLQFWTDPIILLFAIGMAIGVLRRRARRWHAFPSPVVSCLLVLAAAMAAFTATGTRFPMPLIWQAIFAAAASLTIILCTSMRASAPGRASLMLEKAGDASYSTYLSHPLILMVLAAGWALLPKALQNPFAFVILAVILCNYAGLLIHRYLERPLGRALHRWAVRPENAPQAKQSANATPVSGAAKATTTGQRLAVL